MIRKQACLVRFSVDEKHWHTDALYKVYLSTFVRDMAEVFLYLFCILISQSHGCCACLGGGGVQYNARSSNHRCESRISRSQRNTVQFFPSYLHAQEYRRLVFRLRSTISMRKKWIFELSVSQGETGTHHHHHHQRGRRRVVQKKRHRRTTSAFSFRQSCRSVCAPTI